MFSCHRTAVRAALRRWSSRRTTSSLLRIVLQILQRSCQLPATTSWRHHQISPRFCNNRTDGFSRRAQTGQMSLRGFVGAAIEQRVKCCSSCETPFVGLMGRAASIRLRLFDGSTVQASGYLYGSISLMQRSKRKYTDCLLNLH